MPAVSSIAALLLGVGLFLVGSGLLGTLISVRTALEGFATQTTGVIMAAYFAGMVAGSVWGPQMITRVGHIRAFSAFASIYSAIAICHGFVVDSISWAVLRIVGGFAMACLFIVTESWLNARATNETRGRILALYMSTNYLALGLGQFLLPLADPKGFVLFGLVSVLFSLALVPVALTYAEAPRLTTPPRLPLAELYRNSPLGLVGSFAAGMALGAFYGLGPVYGAGIGLSVQDVALFMGITILGGLVAQWPIGRLSDRMDRRTVITAISIAISTLAGLIALLPIEEKMVLFAVACVYGGVSFTIYSMCAAHAYDFASQDQLVAMSAGLMITYGVGAVVGPLLASATMGAVGPGGLFALISVIMALLAAFAVFRMTRRPSIATDQQAPYVAVPLTSARSAHLDPRRDPDTAAPGDAT